RELTSVILWEPSSSVMITLSLHDALPIWRLRGHRRWAAAVRDEFAQQSGSTRHPLAGRAAGGVEVRTGERATLSRCRVGDPKREDRKSTRLNSSHDQISYAVFCLKKKNIR